MDALSEEPIDIKETAAEVDETESWKDLVKVKF